MPQHNRLKKTVMGGSQGDDAMLVVTMLTVKEQ